jgi:hypothetical protein
MIESKYILITDAGQYESDNLFFLICEVIKHRTWHLINHGEWKD